jgi:hypothetical protein
MGEGMGISVRFSHHAVKWTRMRSLDYWISMGRSGRMVCCQIGITTLHWRPA